MSAKFNRPSLGTPSAIAVMAALAVLLATVPSFGDSGLSTATDDLLEAEAAGEDSADSGASGAAQESGSGGGVSTALAKLQVHGFLTQAWAEAEFVDGGPSVNEIAIGIPERGTTSYRNLALQFRYDMSDKDVFVVQFSSRALGDSSIQIFENEIELDWAFYERRLTDVTSLKVGRVQIPLGIYNEIRDVGTLLPFYRPPYNFYKEGTFTNETVDGLSLSHEFFSTSDWGLEATVYAGEWKSVTVPINDPSSPQLDDVVDGYGYQLWLITPFSDFRIGTGLMSARQPGGAVPLEDPRRDIWTAAIDGTVGRFTLRAEYQYNDFTVLAPIGPISGSFTNWYVQTGIRITEKFRIWGQLDVSDTEGSCPCYTRSLKRRFREDLGVSLLYYFSPSILLKGEYHWTDEEFSGLSFDPAVGLFTPFAIPAENGNYTIISLSVSF